MAYGKKKTDKRVLTLRTLIIAAVIIVVGGYGIYRLAGKKGSSKPDERVALASCLTQKGVKMYGAYWCPHCQQQKKDFGPQAFDKIDYVECAIPGDRLDQTQPCKDHNISGYPTWIFADGSRVSGEQALTTLAEKAGCAYGNVKATSTPPQDQTTQPSAASTAPTTTTPTPTTTQDTSSTSSGSPNTPTAANAQQTAPNTPTAANAQQTAPSSSGTGTTPTTTY